MRKYLITTPRVGGTLYGKWLSIELGLDFINEPFLQDEILEVNSSTPAGKQEYNRFISTNDNFLVHTQAGGFCWYFSDSAFPDESEIVFLSRRDKWAQFMSYCKSFGVVDAHSPKSGPLGWHNLDFTEPLEINVRTLRKMSLFKEWTMFSMLQQQYPNAPSLYYEDLTLPNNLGFEKNKGLENVIINDIDALRESFNWYWKI